MGDNDHLTFSLSDFMENTSKLNTLILVLVTPFFILLSHYLAVFPHEYTHSIAAWLLSYKNNPLAIHFGGTSLSNLLLLSNIDENVNYKMIYSLGHPYSAAFIAFAGAGLGNGLLFTLSLILLKNNRVKQRPYLYYFLYWFNLMNLGNFYDYVPIRTFTDHGDIANITMALNISPWWIFGIIGYIVAFIIWHFFTKTMISAYKVLEIKSMAGQASLMIISVLILFGFFGGGLNILVSGASSYYGQITSFLSLTSLLMIPGVVISLWPARL